jgi:hypothetical protein
MHSHQIIGEDNLNQIYLCYDFGISHTRPSP